MQIGTLILLLNGVFWMKDRFTGDDDGPHMAQLLFRVGMMLLGMGLLGLAGLIWLVETLQSRTAAPGLESEPLEEITVDDLTD